MEAMRVHDPFGVGRSRPVKHPAGFSLPELLVVVVILTVLMGLFLPALRRSVRRASSTVCMHQLHDIYGALHAYRMDNRGWLPVEGSSSDEGPAGDGESAWFFPLMPLYVSDVAPLICPNDPARGWLAQWGSFERHPDPANASSYGMNELLYVGSWGNLDRFMPRRPNETILLADMGPDHAHVVAGQQVAAEPLHRNRGRLRWDDGYHPGSAGSTHSWLTSRHLDGINVLTIGGSVKVIKTADLMHQSIKRFYSQCAAGGCTLCREASVAHYSFASDRTYWWTGPLRETE